jgi:hypothetical protein
MTKRLVGFLSALALAMVMALPAVAHPKAPEQSTCVLPAASAAGIHNAYSHVGGVAAHVLEVKSPHFCE